MSDALSRFNALYEALREGRPRPDETGARFAAAALLSGEGEPGRLAETVRAAHAALSKGLKRWAFISAPPTGTLRWVYAAILTANGVPAGDFLSVRGRVRALARSQEAPGLHAGGARAALVLSLDGVPAEETLRRFFELKRALTPPWWRRDTSVTDTFAAAHALQGDSPQSAIASRDAALSVFDESPRARGHKREGARLAALCRQPPREMLARFDRLESARREDRYLKHRSDRSLVMGWAGEGLEPDDLAAIAAIMKALPRRSGGAAHARARLAHLVHTEGGKHLPAASASALSAVLAAQAASIAAVAGAGGAAAAAAGS